MTEGEEKEDFKVGNLYTNWPDRRDRCLQRT